MEYVDQIMRNSFHVLRVVHYGQIIREFMRSHFVEFTKYYLVILMFVLWMTHLVLLQRDLYYFLSTMFLFSSS